LNGIGIVEYQKTRIGRFDQVRLLTTKNIKYLSAPEGTEPEPKGVWSVSSIIGRDELLCVRNSVIIRVPASDVLKLSDYSVEYITRDFGKLSQRGITNGEKQKRETDSDEPGESEGNNQ
jgi:hypothetical protein